LGWTQKDLAKKGNVALGTLRKMEDCAGPVDARTETLIRVMIALEKAGIEFLNDERPGVRLRSPVTHTKRR
jgi:predicted transcriptional regulator